MSGISFLASRTSCESSASAKALGSVKSDMMGLEGIDSEGTASFITGSHTTGRRSLEDFFGHLVVEFDSSITLTLPYYWDLMISGLESL